MKGTKRDFNQLKLDFFSSEEDLKGFLEKRLNKKIDGNISRKTAGRVKERKEYRDKIYNLALQDGEKELKEKAKGRLLKMDDIYLKIALCLEKKLKKPDDLTITDLYTIRKIARTEKGLQTNITKEILNEDKKEDELSEDEKEVLNGIIKRSYEEKQKAHKFDELGLKLDE